MYTRAWIYATAALFFLAAFLSQDAQGHASPVSAAWSRQKQLRLEAAAKSLQARLVRIAIL